MCAILLFVNREYCVMKRHVLLLSLLTLLLAPVLSVSAQDYLPDSAFFQKTVSNTRSRLIQNIGINSALYQGVAYDHYWNRVSGSPFYLSDQMVAGKVFYNGSLYENIPLAYDMVKDLLVTKTFTKNADMSLVSDQVDYFFINTHEFVRLIKNVSDKSVPATGFYERLYNGDVQAYLKMEKKIKQLQKAEDNLTGFVEYDAYYVLKDGVFYEITGESDLVKVFKDQRNEIRKFVNSRGMNYKKDPAKVIVQTAAYYSSLKKGNVR